MSGEDRCPGPVSGLTFAYLFLLLVVYDVRFLVVLYEEHWHRQTITEKRWISHQLKLTWHFKS